MERIVPTGRSRPCNC